MNENLLNILSHSNKDIDNQKLMDYISNSLSEEERYELEKALLDSEPENDAIEGLQQFTNPQDALKLAEELNRALQRQLQKKEAVKEKRRLKEAPWLYVAIALIIVVALIAFFIIRKYLEARN